MAEQNSFAEIIAAISNARSAIVTAHISPDTDAIGSSGALAYYLTQRGLKVTWYLHDKAPARIAPLIVGLPLTNTLPSEPVDLAIICDTATKARIGKDNEAYCKLGRKVVNIDHHVSNSGWGDINYVDPSSASSTQIIFGLLQELKATLPEQILNILLGGLMDDTGSFRFSNTDARTLHAAAEMVDAGAVPQTIANALHFSAPFASVKLRARALAEVTVELDGKVGFLAVSRSVLQSSGATESESEGLVDEVRSIAGTVAGIFIREIEPGKWKLSLRSKRSDLDVNKIASVFSGGGHVAAAGCTIVGTAEEVKEKILSQFATAISSLK